MLNEREVRAAAGILFLFALVAFMNAWLTGDFYYTRVFVIAFLVDFSIRVFVNPRYSPTMIAGRFFVRRQGEELVGAPQKQFAWSIGLALAVTMFYLIVVNRIIGPFNLLICLTCLVLLFFESAFGICIACKIYNLAFQGEGAGSARATCAKFRGMRHRPRITAGELRDRAPVRGLGRGRGPDGPERGAARARPFRRGGRQGLHRAGLGRGDRACGQVEAAQQLQVNRRPASIAWAVPGWPPALRPPCCAPRASPHAAGRCSSRC